MNVNRRILLGVLLAVGFVCLAIVFFRERVPTFQGKTVYGWMLETRSSLLERNLGLSAIGTNAVSYLARALNPEPTFYDRYASIRRPGVQAILKKLPVGWKWTVSSQEVRSQAAYSLLAFGFEAGPALEALHTELLRPDTPDRQTIIFCLNELGPPRESILPLVHAWPLLTNDVGPARHSLLFALGTRRTRCSPACGLDCLERIG
ncbi:MAG: hypothetical protein O2960_22930 [Verrucomicrobia bacterium]|nr:hypothetical protein [Verrucomicrobiota bacterium]